MWAEVNRAARIVRGVRAAVDRFKDAYDTGLGTTYDRTVISGLADGTLLVYGRILRRLQRAARQQPTAPPRALI